MSTDMEKITIPQFVLGDLTERIDKINKHAARLKCPPAVLQVLDRYTRTTTVDGVTTVSYWADITLEMEQPKLEGGWQIVAVIEHHEAGNLVRRAPQFHDADIDMGDLIPACDHCGTRRNRKQTMVVQDEHGTRKQIGMRCMHDFLGHSLPNVWAIWAQIEDALGSMLDDERMGFGGGSGRYCDMMQALSLAAQLWIDNGYTPTSGGNSTRSQVETQMFGRPSERVKISREAHQLATDTHEWIMTNNDRGEFMSNVRVALSTHLRKHIGYVVAMPMVYDKHLQRERERKIVPKVETADVVLGKQTINGVVTSRYNKENDYGVRRVMVVRDDRGFSVWGTVPSAISNLEVGDRVQFDATITGSDKDTTFGFFRRPTKARVTEQVKA